MQWHRSGLIASWEFSEEPVERKHEIEDQSVNKTFLQKHEERKWGVMVIIKSLHFLPAIISGALKEMSHNLHEATPNGSTEPSGFGNMMHIALVGINNQMSLLQDRYCICPLF